MTLSFAIARALRRRSIGLPLGNTRHLPRKRQPLPALFALQKRATRCVRPMSHYNGGVAARSTLERVEPAGSNDNREDEARRNGGPSAFWAPAMTRPNRTDHIRLTSHPEPGAKPRFPDPWGAATARERGPIIGTVSRPADRNVIGTPWRLLCALPRARGLVRRARPDPARRPHQHASGRRPSARSQQWTDAAHASSRSIRGDIWSAEAFQRRDRRRHRHSAEHRRHAGAPRSLTRCSEAVAAGRLAHDGEVVQPNGSLSVVKIAIDPVWYLPGHRRAFRHDRDEPAPHPVRADRRHVPRARDPARSAGVPAADRRHHRLSVRRRRQARRSAHLHHLPRARRVQRLRRVRLRHLHLPALSHPRHRGVRARARRPAASASSSTTARKAGRSARSRSSWSTTRASARKAAMRRPPTSSARNALPACRMRASSS